MCVQRRLLDDIPVLDVRGEFYGDTATEDLRKALASEVTRGTRRLLLNLSECRMMNSLTLEVMVEAKLKVEAIGGEVRLCGVGRRLKSLLCVTRLMEWFNVHEGEVEAIEAFNRARASA
jgi:anti-anti-sigma factor